MFMKMKSEENEKIEIPIYVNILARAGDRNYFYHISMKRNRLFLYKIVNFFKTLRRNITGDCLNCRGMLWFAKNKMTHEITRYIASFWMVLWDVFGYCLVDCIASICVSLFSLATIKTNEWRRKMRSNRYSTVFV